jgi:REP element-mobilizing transposase RayT
MANTYSSLFYHLIFSTKNRVPHLSPDLEPRIWPYIGGVAEHHKMTALQIGGYDDHIHALVMAPPIIAPSQIAQFLKGDSSRWIHETWPSRRSFAWQEGYSAFTVSKSNAEAVIEYIKNQRTHHKRKTFQDEYREFLLQHGIVFDENFVWG